MTHSIILKPGIIQTLDNIFSKEERDQLFMSVHTPSAYRFMGKSNPDDQYGFWMAKIDTEVLSSVPAFTRLWSAIEAHISHGEYRIYQMIINGNTYGDCPTIHTDIPKDATDPEGYYTVLAYANNEWDPDWAGETVLYNDAHDEIIRSVYPRPGRIAVFDSRIPHTSRAPSRLCTIARYTVAIKLVKK